MVWEDLLMKTSFAQITHLVSEKMSSGCVFQIENFEEK